jgi:uncharacterized protein (DUF58 family)
MAGVGREFKASVILSSDSAGPFNLTFLLDAAGPVTPQAPLLARFFNGSAGREFTLTGVRRGKIEITGVWLKWRTPFSLAEIRANIPFEISVSVVQDVYRLHEDALSYLSRNAPIGLKSQPFRGEGSEFECLTEFVAGMDPRHVDWKSSGRHHKLLAREFRQERNHQVVFGFDTGRLSLQPIGLATRLDHFVSAALRLGWVGLKSGDLVGACGYDVNFHSFLKPSGSRKQFAALRAFAASLEYRLEETNHALALSELKSRLPRRSLIVLFAEFADDVSAELFLESLALLTRRHMVIFVAMADPAFLAQKERPLGFGQMAEEIVADSLSKAREIALSRIKRLGALCVDATPGQITSELLNKYLLIKKRGLL